MITLWRWTQPGSYGTEEVIGRHVHALIVEMRDFHRRKIPKNLIGRAESPQAILVVDNLARKIIKIKIGSQLRNSPGFYSRTSLILHEGDSTAWVK